jgi:multidrug efflux pump
MMEIAGFSFVGSGENAGMGFIRLKPWSERTKADEQIGPFMQWANRSLSGIKGAQIFVVNLPTIRGLSQFGGFDMELEDRAGLGHAKLMQAMGTLLGKAAHNPTLAGVRPNGLPPAPQLQMTVDRVQAASMGLTVGDVYNALQLMLAPVFVNDFNYQGRVLRVLIEADAPFRMGPQDLDDFYTTSSSGAMVPLSTVVHTKWTLGSPTLTRYNGYGSIEIVGNAAPGYSSGQAMTTMQDIVRNDLPRGIGYEWTGQSYQEVLSGQQAPILYTLSMVVVFLALAALYESWSIPIAVLLVVPMGVLGSLLLTWLRGLPDDIYFKVGLIAIIGLSAKNAILIVEFAREQQLKGMGLIAATLEAARLRLRPILMTSIAFILGVLPLAISSGAGANSRHSIGTGVIGGMLGATVIGLLLIPVFYVVVRRLAGDKTDGTEATGEDVIRPFD